MMTAAVIGAALVPAARLVTMAMTMRPAWLLLLAALLFRQLRQLMRHHLDLHMDQPLDIAQITALGSITEADGDAFGAGARGAADAVNIAFRLVGQLEIHHMG